MAESAAEAKQRRSAVQSDGDVEVGGPASGPSARVAEAISSWATAGRGIGDATQKGRRTLLGTLKAAVLGLARGVRRRRRDLLAGGGLLTFVVLGYAYVVTELLQPPEGPVLQVLRAAGYGAFALFLANGLGVILHGPGRVPEGSSGHGPRLPAAMEAALEVGRFSPGRPFRGSEGWCFECMRWKPPLAHHCSVCNRCSLWMDHHCILLAQCVGFRNLRCFVSFLASAQVLIVLLLLLAVRRLSAAEASLDRWVAGRVLLFGTALVYALRVSHSHFRFILLKISRGWPSGVLLTKYTDVAGYAQEVVRRFADMPASSMKELCAASQRVVWPGGGLRGLFAREGLLASLALAFGEPASWRWLLPLRPGGCGDPLRPAEFCEDACRAWADLAEALDKHHAMMAQVQRLMALRQQEASAVAARWTPHSEVIASSGGVQDARRAVPTS